MAGERSRGRDRRGEIAGERSRQAPEGRVIVSQFAPAVGEFLDRGTWKASRQGRGSSAFTGRLILPIRNRVDSCRQGPRGTKPSFRMRGQRPLSRTLIITPKGVLQWGRCASGVPGTGYPGSFSKASGLVAHACTQHKHDHEHRCSGRCCLPPTPATSGQTCASASSTLSSVARRSASTNRAGNHFSNFLYC